MDSYDMLASRCYSTGQVQSHERCPMNFEYPINELRENSSFMTIPLQQKKDWHPFHNEKHYSNYSHHATDWDKLGQKDCTLTYSFLVRMLTNASYTRHLSRSPHSSDTNSCLCRESLCKLERFLN